MNKTLRYLKNLISLEYFATTHIANQALMLIALSFVLIVIFSVLLGSMTVSIDLFLDPSSIAKEKGLANILLAFIEVLIGLFVGGALISILTSALVQITSKINSGVLPYKGKGHILIINHNKRLRFMLDEFNHKFMEDNSYCDIVIFVPLEKDISNVLGKINKYSNINVLIKKGHPFLWESYERININHASQVVIQLNSSFDDNFLADNFNLKLIKFIIDNSAFNPENNIKKDLFTIETYGESHTIDNVNNIFNKSSVDKVSIINSNKLLSNILNRSLLDKVYYEIFRQIVCFEGFEIYLHRRNKLFHKDISFYEANLSLTDGILLGVKSADSQEDKILLNPSNDYIIRENDYLILLLENKNDYKTNTLSNQSSDEYHFLKKPKLKESKKICMIGDYDPIDINNISDFIDQDSIDSYTSIKLDKSEDYFNADLWHKIYKERYDTIIMNLNDEEEFHLTLFLQGLFSSDKSFLIKIINILHDPDIACLLNSGKASANVILSEKMTGEFLVQATFSHFIIDIFEELTTKEGNEFYLLDKETYGSLFILNNVRTLKECLLKSDMVYIGTVQDGSVEMNSSNLNKAAKIIVLAKGE